MRTITFRDALNEALDEEMSKDEHVFIMGEDVGFYGNVFKVTDGLFDKYGAERLRDTPISESAIVGTALGAAACGFRPVAEIMFCDFLNCAMDQVINQVAKMRYMFGGQVKIPLVIRTTIGAGLSAAAQHSQSNEAFFMHTPGLLLVLPTTPYDAKGLLKSAIREDNPVIFFENKNFYNRKGEVPEEEYLLPLGKADIKRSGKDVTVVATLDLVNKSLQAAQILEKDGIDIEVIDLRTLTPLDKNTVLSSVKKTHHLVVAMEEVKTCGAAAEIACLVSEEAFDSLNAPIARVCTYDTPIPFNPQLEQYVLPQVEDVLQGVKKVLNYKKEFKNVKS
jgi:pyruvate dehydrogenase E1 component beta subunit